MNWWCSSSPRNWTWTPQPYIGAWVILGAVIGLAVWWRARGRHQTVEPDAREAAALEVGSGPYPSSARGRTIAFAFGIVGLWACLDWPLASLGAGYLASAQMIRQILMTLVVAPLLLFACPAPLAVRLVGWGRRLTVLRWCSKPVLTIPVVALSLVAINAPAVLDPAVSTAYGAFALDLVWIVAGFLLWMPVQCPHPGVRRLDAAFAVGYLIIQSVVPIFPGLFMTWADYPIYSTYELAPRAFEGFTANDDQAAAAGILQIGGMVLLWIQIAYRFLHWAYQQMEQDKPGRNRKPIAEVRTPAS